MMNPHFEVDLHNKTIHLSIWANHILCIETTGNGEVSAESEGYTEKTNPETKPWKKQGKGEIIIYVYT